MKKYYNPEMIVEIIEIEDILTSSMTIDANNVTRMTFGEDFT